MDGYSYEAAGNLLNDGAHNYKYDAENRIIQVDSGTTAAYVYDAEGNRVQKTAAASSDGDAAGIKIYLYDQSGHPIQEFTPALWQGHIYAGSRHLATVGSATTFSHSDWLGTERVRTTYAGAVCGSIASLPFGDGQTTTSPPIRRLLPPQPPPLHRQTTRPRVRPRQLRRPLRRLLHRPLHESRSADGICQSLGPADLESIQLRAE